jgi:hypothetical protein
MTTLITRGACPTSLSRSLTFRNNWWFLHFYDCNQIKDKRQGIYNASGHMSEYGGWSRIELARLYIWRCCERPLELSTKHFLLSFQQSKRTCKLLSMASTAFQCRASCRQLTRFPVGQVLHSFSEKSFSSFYLFEDFDPRKVKFKANSCNIRLTRM